MTARFKEQGREIAYRVYVTDALKTVAESTARFAGGHSMARRYVELLKQKPADNRTGDEIIADMIERGGLVVT